MTFAMPWSAFSDAYGFLGVSLLEPVIPGRAAGLHPAFWSQFPTFGDAGVRQAVEACMRYAQGANEGGERATDEAITRASVEFTRLFLGPPAPAAPPWETLYQDGGSTVGFGQATFQMRELLREAGLQLSNRNHQYEDHMGIELLYLSVLCRRQAEGENLTDSIRSFIHEHPLAWAGLLHGRVAQASPAGYLEGLTCLVESLLTCHVRLLAFES